MWLTAFLMQPKYLLNVKLFNPFQAIVLILYPPLQKTPENLWFYNVFRGYTMEILPRNGLIHSKPVFPFWYPKNIEKVFVFFVCFQER